MIKIKSIKFKDHDILGNLELDFCDKDGNPADTIIIAGENGTGKTTILEEIRKIMTYKTNCANLELKVVCDDKFFDIIYGEKINSDKSIVDLVYNGIRDIQASPNFQNETQFNRYIYSSVNINFSPSMKVKTVPAYELDIDRGKNGKEFNENTAIDIKNLFVGITTYDNKIIADNAKNNVGKIITEEILQGKMDIFKDAFNTMFKNLKFDNIDNKSGNIEILFEKNGEKISIDDLSSGEKQIVFRGAFLLRDKNALNGAVVLIDEPEISMHPKWQEKILDYYRNLFVDNDKKQTSQIIISTHSNFVIENALKLDNFVIVALQEKNQPKKIMKNDGTFILPSVTAAEINYHVFDIASIDYHIQLFGYLQSLMEDELSDKNGKKINMSIKEVDTKIKSNQDSSKNVLQDSQGNACKWIHSFVDKEGNTQTTIYDTICCFIRNAIDHPENLPNQNKKEYTKDDLRYSIEILIDLIKPKNNNQLI